MTRWACREVHECSRFWNDSQHSACPNRPRNHIVAPLTWNIHELNRHVEETQKSRLGQLLIRLEAFVGFHSNSHFRQDSFSWSRIPYSLTKTQAKDIIYIWPNKSNHWVLRLRFPCFSIMLILLISSLQFWNYLILFIPLLS